MPFPNEHAGRIRDPRGFDTVRRQNNAFGVGIHAIFGIIGTKSQLQSIRFDKNRFTPAEARRWLIEHNHKAILFEPATGKQKASRSMSKHKKRKNRPDKSGLMALYGVESHPEIVSAVEKNEQGQPTRRYKKDVIHTGHYRHPKDDWTLDVTPERMDKWVDAFKKMRANGVDVEIVRDHSDKADDIAGYNLELFREGDTLYAIPEMIGQESIDLAERVKNVSVLIDKDFVDGTGTHYGEAITHISIVQSPVVPGQEPFERMAASRGGTTNRVPLLYLGVNDMSNVFADLQKLIGTKTELTEDNTLDVLTSHLEGINASNAELTTKIEGLTADISKLTTAADNTSDGGDKPVTMDEDAAAQAADTAEERLSLLVEAGKITPDVAKQLSTILVGEPGNLNVMALSIKGQSDKKSLSSKIISALKQNDIIKLSEKTGHQITLSRQTPDAVEGVDKKVTEEMTKTADGNATD